MTTFGHRKFWRVLKSHTLTESAALYLSLPKSLFSPHPCRSRFSFFHFPSFPSAFCLFIWEYDLSWWLKEEIEKNVYFRKKKCLERVLMYSFKRIDAVARKKINLSRHQAQEQLQRRMGVNCESLTMPVLQMDFSVCVSYWDAGSMRGGERKGRGRKGVSEKSNFVSSRPNFVTGVILIH